MAELRPDDGRMASVISLIREMVSSGMAPLRVAEIGVFQGRLGREVLKELGPDHVRTYVMVDPWVPYTARRKYDRVAFDQMAQTAYRSAENDRRIIVIRDESLEVASLFADGSLDLVFIDALHAQEHVRADIRAWWPTVSTTGILAGHDYRNRTLGVVQAVNESFVHHPVEAHPGTVWAVRKNGEPRL